MALMKRWKYLLLSFGAVLICVFALFKMEYATDTYCAYGMTLEGIGDGMFKNGRYITGLFAHLFYSFNWSIVAFYYTSFILSIIFMSLAIYTLFTMLRDNMSRLLAFFIAFISVFNIGAIEYFLFLEKGAFAFSILMAILALKCFVEFLKGKKWVISLSFVFLILSALTYQIIPGVFVALCVAFIAKYSTSVKSFIINNLLAVCVYGSGTILDYMLVRLTQENERVGSGIHISNIFKFYSFNTMHYGFIFLYFGIFALSVLLFFGIRYLSLKERPCKSSLLIYSKYLYVVLGAMAVTVLPFVFVRPEEVWFMLRVAYPIFSIPGSVLILLYLSVDRKNESKKSTRVGIIITASIISLCVVFFNTLTFSRLANNKADHELYNTIYSEILEYERESSRTIKRITIYYDSSLTHTNPNLLSFGDCNLRAFARHWSDVNIFVALSGREFIRTYDNRLINQEYKSYFLSQNWDSYSYEQLIFDGDTLHLCIY